MAMRIHHQQGLPLIWAIAMESLRILIQLPIDGDEEV
jgi:hypothetical protein